MHARPGLAEMPGDPGNVEPIDGSLLFRRLRPPILRRRAQRFVFRIGRRRVSKNGRHRRGIGFWQVKGCVTMCHMKTSTVRDLHLKTSEIVRQVAEGESFIIEKRGVPVAEIRPISHRPAPRMPDREALIMSGPETLDSGLILEQDRT
jgi:antitoxin (DNA-binding transcriptional repressor) of toxin-antitoxin stability system